MSQLIVRNLDPIVVTALQRRAAANGRSAEAEHREILREALLIDAEADAFKKWLLAIPRLQDHRATQAGRIGPAVGIPQRSRPDPFRGWAARGNCPCSRDDLGYPKHERRGHNWGIVV